MSEKISAMPTASALTGSELVPVVQAGDNKRTTAQAIADLSGGGLGYLVYTALMNQTGVNDPVATVLGTNTIGAIVWTRNTNDNYQGDLAGAFPVGKTWLSISPGININVAPFEIFRNSDDNIVLISDGFGDGGLVNRSIEIRVYP